MNIELSIRDGGQKTEDGRQMMRLNMEFRNIKNSGVSKKKPVNIVLAITVTLMGIFMSLILCPEAVYYGDFFMF